MKYTFKEIVGIIGDKMSLFGDTSDTMISEISIDSRFVKSPSQTLFFALQGSRVNGIIYLPALYELGVRHFVINEDIDNSDYPEANFIIVDNVLASLQKMATWHRQHYNIPVIGITGSNGKTIVKEWLHHLLESDFNICRSPGSYNSQLGVPLSVLRLNNDHDLGIFEAGISTTDEMPILAKIIDCSIGIFTHLGDAHDAGFVDNTQKAREKLRLFDRSELIIFNKDDLLLDEMISTLKTKNLSWGKSKSADFVIKKITHLSTTTIISVRFKDQHISIEIPFTDLASVENAMHCLLILHHMNKMNQQVLGLFNTLPKVAMRLELLHGWNGMLVVNDTYSADIESLKVAMKFADQQAGPMAKYLVISEFVDVGLNLRELHQQILDFAQLYQFEAIVFIGQYDKKWNDQVSQEIRIFNFTQLTDFENNIDDIIPSDSMVLLKGARRFKFESITQILTKPIEGTRLEIDLGKIKHNLAVYQNKLASGVKIMAMIKASAYGAGFVEMARFLKEEGVEYFGVAYISEGISLRKAGTQLPILVMNPEPGGFYPLLKYDLEPVVYDLEEMSRMNKFLSLRNEGLKVHIKINTGMNRLGFSWEELTDLKDLLAKSSFVKVQSIFTHLSATDDPTKDDFTRDQIDRFDKSFQLLTEGLGILPLRHVLNSSGIMAFPDAQMDMVRLGIGLYGLDERTNGVLPLEITHRFVSYVAQVRTVKKGECIGYGANNPIKSDRVIATISTGYADGIPRSIGNGKYSVYIRGAKARSIGNICMDMFMIDVSDIDDVQRGDEVVIFGNEPSIEELAKAAATIPYEIISSIGDRVKRVFIYE